MNHRGGRDTVVVEIGCVGHSRRVVCVERVAHVDEWADGGMVRLRSEFLFRKITGFITW